MGKSTAIVAVACALLFSILGTARATVDANEFANFANNINGGFANNHIGRYFLDDRQTLQVIGTIPGSGAVVNGLCWVGGVLVGCVISHYGDKALNALDKWVLSLFDPQDAFLFTDFKVGEKSIFNDLVTTAISPGNRLFEAYL